MWICPALSSRLSPDLPMSATEQSNSRSPNLSQVHPRGRIGKRGGWLGIRGQVGTQPPHHITSVTIITSDAGTTTRRSATHPNERGPSGTHPASDDRSRPGGLWTPIFAAVAPLSTSLRAEQVTSGRASVGDEWLTHPAVRAECRDVTSPFQGETKRAGFARLMLSSAAAAITIRPSTASGPMWAPQTSSPQMESRPDMCR
jgi:hypothetical protein